MSKVSMPVSNDFCPQTLFLYGTYKEDGTPNFGLFCWMSYYWDGELGVMACLDGKKLTKDRIRAGKVFSANLVTEKLLPLADYFGNVEGYQKGKMDIPVETERGKVLDVPILSGSPVSFELMLDKSIPLDGGDVFLCKIKNVLVDGEFEQGREDLEKTMRTIAPVCTSCESYFSWDGRKLGNWGQPKESLGFGK